MRVHRYIATAALLVAPAVGFGAVINGDVADQFIAGPIGTEPQDANGTSVGNPGGHTLKIGSVGANLATSGRVPVYVFQLPDLGATANPFAAADMQFSIAGTNAGTTVNVDLYGLARRDATAGVQTVDYFLGDLDTTDATLIQDNIVTPDMANVAVNTSAAGDLALASFLNAQYAAGAGAGQYVYLRVNVDGPMSASTGYNGFTADDDVVENRPFITYSAVPEPASLGLIGLAGLALVRRRQS